MRVPRRLRTWTIQFAIAFVVWSVLAVIYGLQWVRQALVMEDRRIPLGTAVWPAFETYWIYALLTPATIEFALRVEFRRDQMRRFVLSHAAGFAVFSIAQAVLRLLLFPVHNPHTGAVIPRSWAMLYNLLWFYLSDNIFMYVPIVGGTMAWAAYAQNRQRELSQTQLRAQLASAELQILKMQLHPHFLFNTLQAISTLVGKDPQTAKRMIALLGDLLRATIDRSGEQVVALRDELDLLDRYVQIEQVRFGDLLRVEFEIDDATQEARVPTLILQPLVENAIRHGARSQSGPATVCVRSSVCGEQLRLTIQDNGPGMPASEKRNPAGLGLENTRARLGHLYGAGQRLELENLPAGGLLVTVEIPMCPGEQAP
ncbi:MAG TPA: histidine kinase [Bryobacteraceae bacterium]|nr:histidine kinase [Bryobacteraceae bacterium]